ncbi:hypothetical protein, partial [Pseudomonas savastanoi]|uniref:hypothetical protein n=1 Tax=Pseudomonas savastanoi TaxID=29438 RepID=UPI001D0C7501
FGQRQQNTALARSIPTVIIGMDFPSCGFDAGLTLHHGTSMPIRDFRRALWTGKSLSFAKVSDLS